MVCWGVGWFGCAAVLCVTQQTWSQQLPCDILSSFCARLLLMTTIYQEGANFMISTREMFGLEAISQLSLLCALLKHLLK